MYWYLITSGCSSLVRHCVHQYWAILNIDLTHNEDGADQSRLAGVWDSFGYDQLLPLVISLL